MTREQDFAKASAQFDGIYAQVAFSTGCGHGYQYAIEHSDDVIRLIVKMAKKDIAFTEEEAVKFYREEMEEQ